MTRLYNLAPKDVSVECTADIVEKRTTDLTIAKQLGLHNPFFFLQSFVSLAPSLIPFWNICDVLILPYGPYLGRFFPNVVFSNITLG